MGNYQNEKPNSSPIPNNDETNSKLELKVVQANTYSQIEAEDEIGLSAKKKVIETWDELIYWQSVYLEEVRKRGGTMGHKVGSLRDQQIQIKELFKKL